MNQGTTRSLDESCEQSYLLEKSTRLQYPCLSQGKKWPRKKIRPR